MRIELDWTGLVRRAECNEEATVESKGRLEDGERSYTNGPTPPWRPLTESDESGKLWLQDGHRNRESQLNGGPELEGCHRRRSDMAAWG